MLLKIQLKALTKYIFFDTFVLVYRLEIVIRVNTIYGYQLIIIEHQLNRYRRFENCLEVEP